jgi:proteasome beta subunit
VVVGGLHPNPLIYTLDPLGSLLPDDYAAVGTGAEMALGLLYAEYKKGFTEAAAKSLVIKSIKSSIQRDSASGDGIDVLSISNKGMQEESIKL